MTEVIIHKLNITAEAKFDIREVIGLERFDMRTLKSECEEYITRMTEAGRIPWWGYFRSDYIDEDSGERLKLFFYKGDRLGLMQAWDLKGVCLAADWSEEAEDDGAVRLWLESSITEFKKGDWVFEQIANAEADALIMGNMPQGSTENLPKEVRDALIDGTSEEFTQTVSHFKNTNKEQFGRG